MTTDNGARAAIESLPKWDKRTVPGGFHVNRADVLAIIDRYLLDAAELSRLVDKVIFDIPIGDDVTYSRGYSAGVAAARESLRDALRAALAPEGSAGTRTVWPRWECSTCRKTAVSCSRTTCCPDCNHDPVSAAEGSAGT